MGPVALNPRSGVLTRRGDTWGRGPCADRGRGLEDAATSQTHQELLGGRGGRKEPSGALEGAQSCLPLLDFGPRLQSCKQRSACSFKPICGDLLGRPQDTGTLGTCVKGKSRASVQWIYTKPANVHGSPDESGCLGSQAHLGRDRQHVPPLAPGTAWAGRRASRPPPGDGE